MHSLSMQTFLFTNLLVWMKDVSLSVDYVLQLDLEKTNIFDVSNNYWKVSRSSNLHSHLQNLGCNLCPNKIQFYTKYKTKLAHCRLFTNLKLEPNSKKLLERRPGSSSKVGAINRVYMLCKEHRIVECGLFHYVYMSCLPVAIAGTDANNVMLFSSFLFVPKNFDGKKNHSYPLISY